MLYILASPEMHAYRRDTIYSVLYVLYSYMYNTYSTVNDINGLGVCIIDVCK